MPDALYEAQRISFSAVGVDKVDQNGAAVYGGEYLTKDLPSRRLNTAPFNVLVAMPSDTLPELNVVRQGFLFPCFEQEDAADLAQVQANRIVEVLRFWWGGMSRFVGRLIK